MDLGSLWDLLPPELKGLVLSKLPVRERARVRAVCREWATLLDSNPLLWTDVRRLTVYGHFGVLTSPEQLESVSKRGSGGPLSAAELATSFQSAVNYLAPRSPITTLEFLYVDFTELCEDSMEELLASAAISALKLRSLICYRCSFDPKKLGDHDWEARKKYYGPPEPADEYAWMTPVGQELKAILAKLIRSQPMLETLVLGCFRDDIDVPCLAPMEEIAQLRHLRILFLNAWEFRNVRQIPAVLLARLNCLAVASFQYISGDAFKEVMETNDEHVKNSGSSMRRVQRDWKFAHVAWAKEGFRAAPEMADKARYSRNHALSYEWMS